MAEAIQLRIRFREEANSLGYTGAEAIKYMLKRLDLHQGEENRRAHELATETAR
jgi:hypothetical protein